MANRTKMYSKKIPTFMKSGRDWIRAVTSFLRLGKDVMLLSGLRALSILNDFSFIVSPPSSINLY